MPAKSEAQRRYLNMQFGHAWVKEHGFDNKGELPAKLSARERRRAVKNAGRARNPMALDPTRTVRLRINLVKELRRRFARLRLAVARHLEADPYELPTTNADPTRDELGRFASAAVSSLAKDWGTPQGAEPGLTQHEMAEQWCSHFAHAAVRRIQLSLGREVPGMAGSHHDTDDVHTSRTKDTGDGEGHMWVTVAGKHYDPEVHHGVDDPHDLPWFKRHPGFQVQNAALAESHMTLTWEERRGLVGNTLDGVPLASLQKTLPDVRQDDDYDCGAAAAMAVGRYYNRGPVTLQEWRQMVGSDETGTRPEDLVKALQAEGLHTDARGGMTLDDLRRFTDRMVPVIVPVKDPDGEGHWLTVLGVGEDVVAHDPLRGLVSLEPDDFMVRWHDDDSDGDRFVRYGIAVTVVTVNTAASDKLTAFQAWLKTQVDATGLSDAELWQRYVQAGYRKGAGRAFDDTNRKRKASAQASLDKDKGSTFYEGGKDEFLRSSFGAPESVEKVQLLADRSFDELENVTADMSNRMSRHLVDGLTQGKNPRQVARDMMDDVDISQKRAEGIARHEIIRAHAEGQLDSLERMGVAHVGAAVEWSDAGDGKVCERCRALKGIVLTVKEARGLLPRHVNCRCAWLPAIDEEDGQLTTRAEIRAVLKESGDGDERWPGADRPLAKKRPLATNVTNLLANVFCPTGEGGGVDASCSPSKFTGKLVGTRQQEHSAKMTEMVARMVGGKTEKQVHMPGQQLDKKPFDVRARKAGVTHDVEVKTLMEGQKQSLSVHDDALLRKVRHVEANPSNVFHTVAVDERATWDGGAHSDNYSGHRIYYKRGSDRYALSKMHRVSSAAELNRLLRMSDDELPEKAKGGVALGRDMEKLAVQAQKAGEARAVKDKRRKAENRGKLNQQARERSARAKAAREA